MKLRSVLGRASSFLEWTASTLRQIGGLTPNPPNPSPERAKSLEANIEHLTERFEVWHARFETELRQIVEHLERLESRFEARPTSVNRERLTLRPPPLPSELAPASPNTPSRISDSLPGAAPPGPTLRGMLERLGLSTLLGMLELERRSGVLKLTAGERHVELDLRRGAIVRARVGVTESEIVPALGEVFAWEDAEFFFETTSITADSDSPRSMDGLLLELFRQKDEANRAI
jgi:hypothetical protein